MTPKFREKTIVTTPAGTFVVSTIMITSTSGETAIFTHDERRQVFSKPNLTSITMARNMHHAIVDALKCGELALKEEK